MDLDYIKQKVNNIREIRGDAEGAHSYEDDLYSEFISHVAESGSQEFAAMAKEVLKTQEIKFPRWCA